MITCELCFKDTPNRKPTTSGNSTLLLCHQCRDWTEYWDNLTPEERREEDAAMGAYMAELERERVEWGGVL